MQISVNKSSKVFRGRNRRAAAVIGAAIMFTIPGLAHAGYTFTDLSALTPAGTTKSRAYAINDSGQLLGDYTNSSQTRTYFSYNIGSSALTPFPVIDGTQLSYDQEVPDQGGHLINNSGNYGANSTINSFDPTNDGTYNGGFYNPATSAFTTIPPALTYQVSGQQIATGIRPYGINDSNYVVGQQFFETDPGTDYPGSTYHGFIYNPTTGTTTDIGGAVLNSSLNATSGFSKLVGISNNNLIVGSTDSNQGSTVALLGIPNGSGGYTYQDLSSLLTGIIPAGESYDGSAATNISPNGKYIIGTYTAVNSSGGSTTFQTRGFEIINDATAVDLGNFAGVNRLSVNPFGVNDSGQVVGDATASSGTHAFLYSNGTLNDLNNLAPTSSVTFLSAQAINDAGQIVGYDSVAGGIPFNAYLLTYTGPPTITWNNDGVGDGKTWDTTQLNWNNSGSTVAYSNTSNGSLGGDNVVFTDVNNGNYNVSIPSVVSPTSTTVNTNSSTGYLFNGGGGIGGVGGLTKLGVGSLTLATSNTYTGATNISGGSVILSTAHALPAGTNLTINGSGSTLIANNLGTAYALSVGTLNLSGGTLDLKNNDLVVHSGTLTAVSSLVHSGYNHGAWNGATGIISSAAASHPLMALGTILNDNGKGTQTPLYGSGGTLASSFGGVAPVDGDVLVKYTYYGDANLDGKVDGTDYALIDNSYLSEHSSSPTSITGWYNGDFNYDGVVDGSDYTLIDNAFNSQGSQIASLIASPSAVETAQLAEAPAGASVPEPTTLFSAIVIAAGCLLRRSRHKPSRQSVGS